MKPEAFIVTPENYTKPLSVLGVDITVLAAASQTGGYQITIQAGAEGVGPPPHHHEWDESFFVLEGTVDLSCNGTPHHCRPGSLIHVPAGTVHSFQYGPGGGKMLEITSAGSTAIEAFTAIDREIPPGPPDIPKLIELFGRHGVIFEK